MVRLEERKGRGVVLCELPQAPPPMPEFRARRDTSRRFIYENPFHFRLPFAVDCVYQRFFTVEVAVDGAGTDLRPFRDKRHGGAIERVLAEEPEGGVEDRFALGGRFGDLSLVPGHDRNDRSFRAECQPPEPPDKRSLGELAYPSRLLSHTVTPRPRYATP